MCGDRQSANKIASEYMICQMVINAVERSTGGAYRGSKTKGVQENTLL